MDSSTITSVLTVCDRDENNTVDSVWRDTINALNSCADFSLSNIDDETHTADVLYFKDKIYAQFKLEVGLNPSKKSVVYVCTSKTLIRKALDNLASIVDSNRKVFLGLEQSKPKRNEVYMGFSRFVAKKSISILIVIIIVLGLVINFTFCSGPSKSEHDGQRLYITSTGERVWVDEDTYDHLNGK